MSRPVPRVLSIAGTDPTGGAGIQADLKSIGANGGYGMAATTALVAQNTRGVRSMHVPPPEFLTAQLEAVSEDVEIDAVKIGMLFDAGIIAAVRAWLEEVRPPVVVLDPVIIAASGDALLDDGAQEALRELLGLADLVTPNLPELAALLGDAAEARTAEEAAAQAQRLAAAHGVLVLAKGGHLTGDGSPDALVGPGDVLTTLPGARIATTNTHGTGCSLSSAIATRRGRGEDWPKAVRAAKAWLSGAIARADELEVGRGSGPVSHFAQLWEAAGTHRPRPEEIAAQWWQDAAELREQIDGLPFVRQLGRGTLPAAAFGRAVPAGVLAGARRRLDPRPGRGRAVLLGGRRAGSDRGGDGAARRPPRARGPLRGDPGPHDPRLRRPPARARRPRALPGARRRPAALLLDLRRRGRAPPRRPHAGASLRGLAGHLRRPCVP